MRPEDLFLEAAKHVGPDYSGRGHAVDERERRAYEELRLHAAAVLDTIFDELSYAAVDFELSQGEGFRFDDVQFRSTRWSGETKTTTSSDGTPNGQQQVTRRWVSLDVEAEPEFHSLAPAGYHVRKLLLIGVHDISFSQDGQNFGHPAYAASLEVITGLHIAPDNDDWTQLETGDVFDPFRDTPPIVERLNHMHPVFSDYQRDYGEEYRRFYATSDPVLRQYPTGAGLVEGIHAAIDDFEKALGY